MHRIYFDHAATTATDPLVVEAMLPYFTEKWGNPSSLHAFGQEAHAAMDEGRKRVAALVGAKPDEMVFTAGGSEADNLAIKGVAMAAGKGHIITSSIEHPAVLNTCKYLEARGFEATYLPVDKEGIVSPQDVAEAIRKDTILITVMHSSNEIGALEPIEEIGKMASERGITFHTDAVQSVGKMPLDPRKMGAALVSMASHKIYGPKGIGALYVPKGMRIEPLMHGGGHERGLRSSTENVPGIVGFGKAAELALARMDTDIPRIQKMRDRIIDGILGSVPDAYLNGPRARRLPNNAHFRFSFIEGESLLLMLDMAGIAASTGSACSSKSLKASHVLLAIGLSPQEAHGSLRITLGRGNTDDEVKYFLEECPRVVESLRKMSPLGR
ncbi:MAG: cysteine desulfurase NifS [Euryarchaeota archaeon]|nr:cysteine desulfurase NifS [Euryarchaeota archaeon]